MLLSPQHKLVYTHTLSLLHTHIFSLLKRNLFLWTLFMNIKTFYSSFILTGNKFIVNFIDPDNNVINALHTI